MITCPSRECKVIHRMDSGHLMKIRVTTKIRDQLPSTYSEDGEEGLHRQDAQGRRASHSREFCMGR